MYQYPDASSPSLPKKDSLPPNIKKWLDENTKKLEPLLEILDGSGSLIPGSTEQAKFFQTSSQQIYLHAISGDRRLQVTPTFLASVDNALATNQQAIAARQVSNDKIKAFCEAAITQLKSQGWGLADVENEYPLVMRGLESSQVFESFRHLVELSAQVKTAVEKIQTETGDGASEGGFSELTKVFLDDSGPFASLAKELNSLRVLGLQADKDGVGLIQTEQVLARVREELKVRLLHINSRKLADASLVGGSATRKAGGDPPTINDLHLYRYAEAALRHRLDASEVALQTPAGQDENWFPIRNNLLALGATDGALLALPLQQDFAKRVQAHPEIDISDSRVDQAIDALNLADKDKLITDSGFTDKNDLRTKAKAALAEAAKAGSNLAEQTRDDLKKFVEELSKDENKVGREVAVAAAALLIEKILDFAGEDSPEEPRKVESGRPTAEPKSTPTKDTEQKIADIYASWRRELVNSIRVPFLPSGSAIRTSISLATFLAVIRGQADLSGLSDEQKQVRSAAIDRAIEELDSARADIGLPSEYYSIDSSGVFSVKKGSGDFQTLLSMQEKFLDNLIQEVLSHRNERPRNIELGFREKPVRAVYQVLREANPGLPEFEEITEVEPKKFMFELTIGIMAKLGSLFDGTTTSGTTKLPFPKKNINLWPDDDGNGSRLLGTSGDIELNFQVFFEGFPWRALYPQATQDQINDLATLWKYRLIAMANSHNLAHTVLSHKDKVGLQDENFKRMPPEVFSKIDDGGGYYPWDLVPFNTSVHEPGSLMFEICGSNEESWCIADMTQLFLSLIQQDYDFLDTNGIPGDFNINRNRYFEYVKSKIPPELNHSKIQVIMERAWEQAFWISMHTLIYFEMDTSGLFSKLGRAMCNKIYGVKILTGAADAKDRIRPTILQAVKTALPDRNRLIHVTVDTRKGSKNGGSSIFSQVFPEDIKRLANGLAAASGTTAPADKFMIGRHQRSLLNWYADLREKSIGKHEDISSLSLKKDAISAFEELIREFKIGFPDEKETIKYLEDLLQQIKDEEDIVILRTLSNRMSVALRYKLLQVNQSELRLGVDHTSIPVAVPYAYLKKAKTLGCSHLLPLTVFQATSSGVPTENIRWDLMTQKHAFAYANLTTDLVAWNADFANLLTPGGIFVPVHADHLDRKISRKTRVFDSPGDMSVNGLFLTHRMRLQNNADALDRKLRSLVYIEKIRKDELAIGAQEGVGVKGWGGTAISQYKGRYVFGKLAKLGYRLSIGDGEPIDNIPTVEFFAEMFRAETRDYRKIVLETPRDKKAELLKKLRTPVHQGVRAVVDEYHFGKHHLAEKEMIVHMFAIAFSAYLDQYRYASIEEGHPIHPAIDLDFQAHHIRTVSEEKPLDFAHRELVLSLFEEQMRWFASDEHSNPPIAVSYDRHWALEQMRERGIVGTHEQVLCDYSYWKEFRKVEETHEKAKKGH